MIKMEALRKMYEDLKFKNVRTYIQSGNIIFQDKPAKPEVLKEKIAKRILKETGFEVPVMVKDIEEIASVLKSNPFLKRKEDTAKLHVTFLSGEPGKETLDKIPEGKYGKDEFILSGRTVFLFCPDGYGNTKLSNNFFENKLKVTATTRNWKTINELHRMAIEVSQEK
jgi:uncharacterized protein (DUF1697 family)